MLNVRIAMLISVITSAEAVSATLANDFDFSWFTIDGGGGYCVGADFELEGAIGQPDAGALSGGTFELAGGFLAGASPAGIGAPAATLTGAVSRKPNSVGPGGVCDLALTPGAKSEPRQGRITELRLTFDVPPGGPGNDPVSIEQATCAAPSYAPYSGGSSVSASVAGNALVLNFTPGLENVRTYRLTLGPQITSIAGQFVEVAVLIGDVNGDGRVNGTDRSTVVGAWTSATHFTCATDVNGDGRSNGTDRSLVVGAWTSADNCVP